MIKYPENLSIDDKMFMIHNKKCFINSDRSFINFNSSEWESLINEQKSIEEINNSLELPKRVKRDMLGKLHNICLKTDSVYKFVDNLCNSVVLETNENIVDFILFVHNHIQHFKNRYKFSPSELYTVYDSLFSVYIPWKIQANRIYKKCLSNIKAADEFINNYHEYIMITLFSELRVVKDPSVAALISYMILVNLNITSNDKKIIEFFFDVAKNYIGTDTRVYMKNLNDLMDAKISTTNMIDRISFNGLDGYEDMIKSDAKRKIEDNYLKSKISDEVNNTNICIGEDIFPDHEPMNITYLLADIDMLDEEEIKRYIDKDKDIIYEINENDIGYLKKEHNAPICKILRKEKGFNTITKIDNVSYLLFKTIGSTDLFGISFPKSNGGQRKLITLTIPNNIDYKLK